MKKDSFEKKLAAYVATAAAFLAAQKESNAQIIYTDVNPDLVIHNSFFNLDLNNDGVVDFKLRNGIDTPVNSCFSCISYAIGNNLIPYGSNKIVSAGSSGFPAPVASMNLIGGMNDFTTNDLLFIHTFQSWINIYGGTSTAIQTAGNFYGINKIAGFSVQVGGNNFYGWIRLDVFADQIILKDYAINSIPDSSVYASVGAAGCNMISYSTIPDGNQLICSGDTIPVMLTNANGTVIQWLQNGNILGGETDTTIEITQSGTYQILIADSACSEIVNAVQFNDVSFLLTRTFINETCENANASINLIINGNSPSYTYLWNTGATTEDLNNMTEGFYTVTVTSSICNVSHVLSVNITNTGNHPTPSINQNGNLLSTQMFYDINWYRNGVLITGANSNLYNATQSGAYYVVVHTPIGCEGISDTINFIYNSVFNIELPEFQFSIEQKQLLFHLADNALIGAQIDIVNGLGQLATSVTVTNQYPSADLSALPGGIYFYHIRSRQKTYSGKFIIE